MNQSQFICSQTSRIRQAKEYKMAGAVSVGFDEKLAEQVRKFQVLYDKSCAEFKDKNKKCLAWDNVAAATGLKTGKTKIGVQVMNVLVSEYFQDGVILTKLPTLYR